MRPAFTRVTKLDTLRVVEESDTVKSVECHLDKVVDVRSLDMQRLLELLLENSGILPGSEVLHRPWDRDSDGDRKSARNHRL